MDNTGLRELFFPTYDLIDVSQLLYGAAIFQLSVKLTIL